MYRAVLLDVYGTLVHDDDALVAAICARVADAAGTAADVVAADWDARLWAAAEPAHGAAFRTLAALTVESLAGTLRALGVPLDAGDLCREQLAWWRRPPLHDDALPFLREIGLPVCLVSDVDEDVLRSVLAHHGITVDAVVTSEGARAYKPRPEPFRLALDRLGLGPGDVVHVGDSPVSDVGGAGALGIDTAYLDRHGRPLPPGRAATRTAPTLTALLPQLHAHALGR